MATKKISQLDPIQSGSINTGSASIPIVNDGTTFKVSPQDLIGSVPAPKVLEEGTGSGSIKPVQGDSTSSGEYSSIVGGLNNQVSTEPASFMGAGQGNKVTTKPPFITNDTVYVELESVEGGYFENDATFNEDRTELTLAGDASAEFNIGDQLSYFYFEDESGDADISKGNDNGLGIFITGIESIEEGEETIITFNPAFEAQYSEENKYITSTTSYVDLATNPEEQDFGNDATLNETLDTIIFEGDYTESISEGDELTYFSLDNNNNDIFFGNSESTTGLGILVTAVVYDEENDTTSVTLDTPFLPFYFFGGFNNIVGGQTNLILSNNQDGTSKYSTIGGGKDNAIIGSEYSVIAGGSNNTASRGYSTVSGGYNNTSSCFSSTVGGGQNNIVSSYLSTIGGGCCNIISGGYSTISGGRDNTASCFSSTIGGGRNNTASGRYSTVSGGTNNTASNFYSTVSGGNNTASGCSSTVGGGICNTASGCNSTVGGGGNNIACSTGTVAGGVFNCACSTFSNSTVGGGCANTASGGNSTVSGGSTNSASGCSSTVSGGSSNSASGCYSTIGGGRNNIASETYSFTGGGNDNTSSGYVSTVSGGGGNIASGSYSFIGGGGAGEGTGNVVLGEYSSILGGCGNTVNNTNSIALGSDITSDKDNTTFVQNLHITGSTTLNGLLELSLRDPLPASGSEEARIGVIAVSGSVGASKPYFFDGTTWNALF